MAVVRDGTAARQPEALRVVVIGALGVVYGDIGTSPLYAFGACFSDTTGLAPTPAHVLGVLSLIFWALIVVVSIKYALFVLRADFHGEGGILALATLVASAGRGKASLRPLLTSLGIFGAALLYGDGMITPAMSVLSAMEGLGVASPQLAFAVVPLTIVILVALFVVQRRGTGAVGRFFGPVMLVWFVIIACLGVRAILTAPECLAAVNPMHGVRLLLSVPWTGFLVLGAVFLVVTGAEAMYADLGHFGARPIRIAWYCLVLPCLLINYFGQGALVLHTPAAVDNSFYRLAPSWGMYPLIALAAAATVIASQAIISGAFSLTHQALELGYVPRLEVRHYSSQGEGRVYIPFVNWVLLAAAVGLVLGFRTAENLAGAYGVAVSATMVITTALCLVCFRSVWGWSLPAALALSAAFLSVDVVFLGANLAKIFQGGWFPILVAASAYLLMTTWHRGRVLLAEKLEQHRMPIEEFIAQRWTPDSSRVPGTAAYVTRLTFGTPLTLLRNYRHNKVLHAQVLLVTIQTEPVPRVAAAERVSVNELAPGLLRVVAHYGFMQTPNVAVLLDEVAAGGFAPDRDLTFFLSRETPVVTDAPGMSRWRKHVFAFLARNAHSVIAEYRVPEENVFEVGLYVRI